MIEILLLALNSITNLLCFYFGAKIGQKVVNKEPVKMDIKTPVQVIKEHEIKKEIKKEQEIEETILHNIDVYDGTSIGQKEIPR